MFSDLVSNTLLYLGFVTDLTLGKNVALIFLLDAGSYERLEPQNSSWTASEEFTFHFFYLVYNREKSNAESRESRKRLTLENELNL